MCATLGEATCGYYPVGNFTSFHSELGPKRTSGEPHTTIRRSPRGDDLRREGISAAATFLKPSNVPRNAPAETPTGAGALAGNTLDGRSPSAVLQTRLNLLSNVVSTVVGLCLRTRPDLHRHTHQTVSVGSPADPHIS